MHVPKTGGNWVRAVLKQYGLAGKEIGEWHGPYRGGRKSFGVLRNPWGWFRSLWAYNMKRLPELGRSRPRNILSECWAEDFELVGLTMSTRY